MEQLLLKGLASWRIAHMLVYEDGPGFIFARIRKATGIEIGTFGEALISNPYTPLFCIACTSIYSGVLAAILPRWITIPIAASGLAIMMERLNGYLQSKDTPTAG